MQRLLIRSYACFQLLLLLVLLVPLLFSLFWVAVRFPIFFPDYVDTTWLEVQPDRLMVIFEHFSKNGKDDSRAWLLDIEAETLEPIQCPEEFGGHWPNLIGKDINGNLIFKFRQGDIKYFGWNARTGVRYSVSGILSEPVLINSRYLACERFEESINGHAFVWCDLSKPERPPCMVPIMKTDSRIIPIEGTDSFYFVLPMDDQYWLETDSSYVEESYSGGSYGGDGDFATEWVNEDGVIEYELPPVVINPSASKPLATVVLMNLNEQGPKEVARWPVVSDDSSEILDKAGYIVCQSVDACFLETHDARTGNIVARIPIPSTALDATMPAPRLNWWSLAGTFILLEDGCGNRIAIDFITGNKVTSYPVGSGWLQPILLPYSHEYLTWFVPAQRADWPGEMQVRAIEDHQVLNSWTPPGLNLIFSSHDDGHPSISSDAHRVRFVTSDLRVVYADKLTGKLVSYIQPRFWLPFIAGALAVAAGVWTLCWIKASIRNRLSCWVDVFLLLVCALCFLYWRINYSGDPDDQQRPAWIGIAALLIAAIVWTVDQVAFCRARLVYRSSPIILITAAAIYIQRSWLRNHSTIDIVFELLLLAEILMGSIAIQVLLLREPVKTSGVSSKTRIVSLRELFAWTALSALMLAVFRLYDLSEWTRYVSPESIVRALMHAGVIAAVSLSAYYLTAKHSWLVLRLLGIGTLMLLALMSAVYRLVWDDLSLISKLEIESAAKFCECVVVLASASMLIALPIAIRNTSQRKSMS